MNLVKTPSRTAAALAVTILLIGGAVAHGQRPQGGGGGPLIIDFSAVTADGKPVLDLKAEDVTVKVAGKVRTISALTMKKIEAPAAAPASAAPAAAPGAGDISAPFFVNDAKAPAPSSGSGGGRFFLIVVDTESLTAGTEAQLKTALGNLLNGLTPADHVAFSIAPHDTAQIGFNGGLAKVREAVTALRGSRPASVNTADSLCRTSDTLNLVKALIDPLQANDVPTSVIFVAGSLSTQATEKSSSGGTCTVTQDQYQSLAATAAAAHANVYVVQGDASSMGRSDGLEALAGVVGQGNVMRVVNEGFAPRVLSDASNYYVATLAPDPSDRPGQSQRLEVKAAKDGVTIRARSEAAVSRNAAPAAAAGPKPGTTTSPKDMIKTTAMFTDLQLKATAYHARGAGDKMNVLVFAEPVDPTVKITAMTVAYFDQDAKGASVSPAKLDSSTITTALPLGVGPYRIRVAAVDSTGKSGAVDINLNTNLIPAGPARLGGLMVGAATDKGMAPRVPVFSTEENVLVMFELYGSLGADTKAKVGFELADSDTGKAKKEFQPTGISQTNEPDKFQVFGEIPIKDLPPGDYVIRGLFEAENQTPGRTIRTFRKVAK